LEITDAAPEPRKDPPAPELPARRRREERRVQAEEGRGQDPGYDPERPEEPGDTATSR
jgi:hypothetical protein